MLKTITKLEHKVGDRVYQFICENDSPLGECHDAITAFKDYVVKKIQEFHEASKANKEELAVKDD